MADAEKPSDEDTESLSKKGESSEEARKSSDEPEDKESKELKGILKIPDNIESSIGSRESSKDSTKSSARSDESKKRLIEEFKIPDDLKEPNKRETPDENPFMLSSLKSSKEALKPGAKTSKELTDSSTKEDSKHTPKPKASVSNEKQLTLKSESTDDYSEGTSATSKKSSDEHPSAKSESKDDYSEERPTTDGSVSESGEEFKGKSKSKRKRGKRRPSFSERMKKKQTSIVKFFKRSSSKKKGEHGKAKPRRSSFIMRKFIGLEEELTTDKINKRVAGIFQPAPLDRDLEKAKEEDEDEEEEEEEDLKPKRAYLSSAMACMFIVGGLTGSALSSLPFYLKQSSWFGVFFNLLLCLNGVYAGLCTGWCWNIMEEAWPEYHEYTRIPYQDIAFRAVGKWMKYIVAICVDVSILGSCCTYILMIANHFEDIFFKNFNFCYLIMVVTVVLIPVVMFNSYRNIKIIGVLDVTSSFLFTLLLIVGFFLDKPRHGIAKYTDVSLKSAALSFGGFSYAYGVGSILPSIMVDMADRTLFSQTVVTAYMLTMVMYLLLPIMGYAAYGVNTPVYILQEILMNRDLHDLAIVIEIIFNLQLAFTFVVSLIPSLHAFEVRLNCPDRFGHGRFLVRIIIMLIILLVILGIPYLPKFMALVGATTMNLLTFIFPPVFYVCLVKRTKSGSKVKKRVISKKEWWLVTEIIILSVFVGVLATYMSAEEIKNVDQERHSCYQNITNYLPETKLWLMNTSHGR